MGRLSKTTEYLKQGILYSRRESRSAPPFYQWTSPRQHQSARVSGFIYRKHTIWVDSFRMTCPVVSIAVFLIILFTWNEQYDTIILKRWINKGSCKFNSSLKFTTTCTANYKKNPLKCTGKVGAPAMIYKGWQSSPKQEFESDGQVKSRSGTTTCCFTWPTEDSQNIACYSWRWLWAQPP